MQYCRVQSSVMSEDQIYQKIIYNYAAKIQLNNSQNINERITKWTAF